VAAWVIIDDPSWHAIPAGDFWPKMAAPRSVAMQMPGKAWNFSVALCKRTALTGLPSARASLVASLANHRLALSAEFVANDEYSRQSAATVMPSGLLLTTVMVRVPTHEAMRQNTGANNKSFMADG
jgi:hypothetical protein